jgi:phosphoglycerate kinase
MRTVRDIPLLANIPVLVRTSLNVPLQNGKVVDTYRLRRALPTIRFLTERGARVVLISHIGEMGTETLAPVADALAKLIPHVSFFPETIGPRARDAVRTLPPGHILVLENLRRHRGEQMNDAAFAHELASLADVFVEDSFDTCHRSHASIIGVPKILPSYAGLTLEDEVRELSKARSPKKPSLAVIGGAKFSTKEAVLDALLTTYDHVFVGGALADDFLQAQGHEIGKSLVGTNDETAIRKILDNPKLILPVDSLVISAKFAGTPEARKSARVVRVDQLQPDDIILDHGPDTIALLTKLTTTAKMILWNGPLGNYENGFTDATTAFARAIAASGAYSIVGGGDTVASIESLRLLSAFSFVSTGGGAMLDFLVTGSLPGIDALG